METPPSTRRPGLLAENLHDTFLAEEALSPFMDRASSRVLSGEWSIEMTSQDAPSIESAKLVTEFFALFDERGSLLFKGGET